MASYLWWALGYPTEPVEAPPRSETEQPAHTEPEMPSESIPERKVEVKGPDEQPKPEPTKPEPEPEPKQLMSIGDRNKYQSTYEFDALSDPDYKKIYQELKKAYDALGIANPEFELNLANFRSNSNKTGLYKLFGVQNPENWVNKSALIRYVEDSEKVGKKKYSWYYLIQLAVMMYLIKTEKVSKPIGISYIVGIIMNYYLMVTEKHQITVDYISEIREPVSSSIRSDLYDLIISIDAFLRKIQSSFPTIKANVVKHLDYICDEKSEIGGFPKTTMDPEGKLKRQNFRNMVIGLFDIIDEYYATTKPTADMHREVLDFGIRNRTKLLHVYLEATELNMSSTDVINILNSYFNSDYYYHEFYKGNAWFVQASYATIKQTRMGYLYLAASIFDVTPVAAFVNSLIENRGYMLKFYELITDITSLLFISVEQTNELSSVYATTNALENQYAKKPSSELKIAILDNYDGRREILRKQLALRDLQITKTLELIRHVNSVITNDSKKISILQSVVGNSLSITRAYRSLPQNSEYEYYHERRAEMVGKINEIYTAKFEKNPIYVPSVLGGFDFDFRFWIAVVLVILLVLLLLAEVKPEFGTGFINSLNVIKK